MQYLEATSLAALTALVEAALAGDATLSLIGGIHIYETTERTGADDAYETIVHYVQALGVSANPQLLRFQFQPNGLGIQNTGHSFAVKPDTYYKAEFWVIGTNASDVNPSDDADVAIVPSLVDHIPSIFNMNSAALPLPGGSPILTGAAGGALVCHVPPADTESQSFGQAVLIWQTDAVGPVGQIHVNTTSANPMLLDIVAVLTELRNI